MRRTSTWRTAAFAWIGIAVFAAAVGGCASKRPIHVVQQSGDRNFAKGDYGAALKDYLEYVDRRPGNGEVRHNLARTLLATNQPSKGVEHAWMAYDDSPQNETYIETLCECLFRAGKTEELHKLVRDHADSRGRVTDYLRLGRFTYRMGDPDGAELAFLTAAKIDRGRTVPPQMALSSFYSDIGDKLAAFERLRMALYLDPNNSEIHNRIRGLGEIPGPTLALPPKELPIQERRTAVVPGTGG